MYQYGFLLAALLVSGCQGDRLPPEPLAELPSARSVATVYRIMSPSGDIPCFRQPSATSPVAAMLGDGQLVDLVSLEEGLTRQEQEYWLHVYPRTKSHPACHVNVRHLVPVS